MIFLEMLKFISEARYHSAGGVDVEIRTFSIGSKDKFLRTRTQRQLTFRLSDVVLNEAALASINKDWILVGNILERNPQQIAEIIQKVQAGDLDSATALALDIGLDERRFRADGGGLGFLAMFAIAVVLVLANPTELSDAELALADPVQRPIDQAQRDRATQAADAFLRLGGGQ